MIHPRFVDHLVFRIADLDNTERFYTAILGPPAQKSEGSVMYRSSESAEWPYEKEKIGLNHIAFGVRTLDELQAFLTQLDNAGLSHSGIKIDKYGRKEFIWLDDPDGMRIEFYLHS